MRSLPERTWRISLLNHIHDRIYAEITQAMQLPQSAVEKYMIRVLDACKTNLAGLVDGQAGSTQP